MNKEIQMNDEIEVYNEMPDPVQHDLESCMEVEQDLEEVMILEMEAEFA